MLRFNDLWLIEQFKNKEEITGRQKSTELYYEIMGEVMILAIACHVKIKINMLVISDTCDRYGFCKILPKIENHIFN